MTVLLIRNTSDQDGDRRAHIDAGIVHLALHLHHGLNLEEVGFAGWREDPGDCAEQQELLKPALAVALCLHTADWLTSHDSQHVTALSPHSR